jgi:signal transduction histidine kinase/HPt (histidine-containing phosphotransfer) domain-containing protein
MYKKLRVRSALCTGLLIPLFGFLCFTCQTSGFLPFTPSTTTPAGIAIHHFINLPGYLLPGAGMPGITLWTTALYLGGLCILGLYHILLFVIVREKYPAYLYYGLYVLSLGMLLLYFREATAASGTYPAQKWLQGGIVVFSLLAIFEKYKLFKEGLPAVHLPGVLDTHFNRIFAGAGLITAVLYFINSRAGSFFSILLLLATCVVIISYTPFIFQKKRLMTFFIWGNIFLLISLLLTASIYLAWTPVNALTVHLYLLFALLHAVSVAAVLAQRINLFTENQVSITKKLLKAEQSQRFKDQFLANTSHEIRTPMNAILGFTRLLEQSDLDVPQQEYVRLIKTSAENLLVIINDILDFSKIESGKIVLEKVNIHLDKLCQSLIETLQLRIAEKNLEVGYYIDDRIPAVFLGDPVRLNQILLNLLTNAIKFTDQGSVFLKVQLTEETDDRIYLHFEVKDTGIGIPEDKLQVIFDSFSQASDQTTRKYGGTGLGLSIVKQLAELQGGRVTVKSFPDEGSTFSVYLHFQKGINHDHAQARNAAATHTLPNNLRILLLEDNPINQILAVNTLQKWMPDINIDVAADGKEGIHKLQEKNYDLMLVDIQMPEMDGYETTRYIRTKMDVSKKNIPIIALTAGALKEDEQKAIAAGMNDYVSKPFDIETLAGKIKRLPISADRHSLSGNKFEIAHVERAGLGEPDFMVQLMNMFLEKTPEALLQMEQFSETGNWKGISFVAHRIKSVFACMGLTHLQKELLVIEESARDHVNLEKIPLMLDQLKKGCKVAYSQIILERDKLINKI